MKKIIAFLVLALIALPMGCVNYRDRTPENLIIILNQKNVILNNKTDYHLTADLEGYDKIVNIFQSELKIINFPKNFRPTEAMTIKVTAWNKNGFPVGSTSKKFKTSQNTPVNSPFVWRITKQDLEY